MLRNTDHPFLLRVFLGVFAVGMFTLFVPHPVGLADNGDYVRTSCRFDLRAHGSNLAVAQQLDVDEFVTRVNPRWDHVVSGKKCSYISSQLVLVAASSIITRGFGIGGGGLDLRVLGVLTTFIVALGLTLLVRSLPAPRRVQLVIGAVATLFLFDHSHALYWISLFTEPSAHIGAVLTVAGLAMLFIPRPSSGSGSNLWASNLWALGFTAVGSLVLVTSKLQNAALGVVVVLALMVWAREQRNLISKAAVAIVAGVLGLSALTMSRSTPKELTNLNAYNVTFFTILRHDNDPKAALRHLGGDASLLRYRGTNAFMKNNGLADPAFEKFAKKFSYKSVVTYYATHPARAIGLFAEGSRAAFSAQPRYLGTTVSTNPKTKQTFDCRFCLVSTITHELRSAAPILLPVFWIAGLVVAWWLRRKETVPSRGLGRLISMVVAFGVTSFAVAVLGDGETEMVKHLATTNSFSALLAVLLLYAFVMQA